jgi:hypothetical protein
VAAPIAGLVLAGCMQNGVMFFVVPRQDPECYQSLTVTVIDDRTGGKTCDATVTLRHSKGAIEELDDCYHAALSKGQYRIRAALGGRESEVTEFNVGDLSDCKPVTSTIMLTVPR